jgi:hypothetical protein
MRGVWLWLGLTFAFACSGREPVKRRVFAHVPAACAPDTSSATGVYDAYGDFESSATRTTQERTQLRDKVELAQLPLETEVIALEIATLSDIRTYRGFSFVKAREDVHVLAWPDLLEGRPACAMTGDLGVRVEGASGRIGRRTFLVSGGKSPDGSNVPRSYIADLAKGRVSQLPIGMNTQRLRASISELGTDDTNLGIVAGGTDPASGRPLDTAELFDANRGDFLATIVKLSAPRTDHAAVTLINGETLLIGGSDGASALRSIDAIDPTSFRARLLPATLAVPRKRPFALRLALGQVMVVGGTDAAGTPVGFLEWLSRDGAGDPARGVQPFPASGRHAALALAGGGALVAIDTQDPTEPNVWSVSALGIPTPVARVPMATGEQPFLFPGSEDRVLLYLQGVWYRFDPWAQKAEDAFVRLPSPPRGGPGQTATTLDMGDVGLVAWLDDQARIRAFRTDLISPFHRLRGVSLQGSVRDFVPDRLVASGGFKRSDAHGLELQAGETATLAHYTFRDIDLGFSGAPELILRSDEGDEFRIGISQNDESNGVIRNGKSVVDACSFNWGSASRVERRGREVRVFSEGRQARCALPFAADSRVSIGFRGTSLPASWVSNVTARRP